MKKQNSLTRVTRKVAFGTASIILLAGSSMLTSCKKNSGAEAEVVTAGGASSKGKATIKSYQSGTNNGFFWSLWKSDGATGTANYANGAGGNYSISWSGFNGNFTCGKGYNAGSPTLKIGYNLGAYTNSGGGTFGWYGWSRYPYYEYYVNETWGTHSPHEGTFLGSFYSDGVAYNAWTTWKSGQNIDGGNGFRQIHSSRVSKVSVPSGNRTITFANHYNYWKSKGYTLGQMNIPAIMVTETWGTNVSGYSNCTIWGL